MLLSLMKGICIRCSTGRRRAHACYVNVPDDNWKENKGEARKDHDREGNVQATSKASVLPTPLSLPPGMTPPSVAAFSSSSDASHAFIFCSRLSDAPSSADGASASPSAMNWGFREVLRAVVWARRGLCGQKACDKCSAVATRRIKRIIVEPREGGG